MAGFRVIQNVCSGIFLAGIFIAALGGCTTTVMIECDAGMGAGEDSGRQGAKWLVSYYAKLRNAAGSKWDLYGWS